VETWIPGVTPPYGQQRTVPRELLELALDFIVGDRNPRERDDEREMVIGNLREHLKG